VKQKRKIISWLKYSGSKSSARMLLKKPEQLPKKSEKDRRLSLEEKAHTYLSDKLAFDIAVFNAKK
jgi:hypothetical protein